MKTAQRNDVIDAIQAIERYHGREIPEAAREVFVGALSGTPMDLLATACLRWTEQNGPSKPFPSVADLRKVISDIRADGWGETKDNSPTWKNLEHQHDPKFRDVGKMTADMVRRRMLPKSHPDKLDHDHMVMEMRRMEKRFPGTGWISAAAQLEQSRVHEREAAEKFQRHWQSTARLPRPLDKYDDEAMREAVGETGEGGSW